LIPPILMKTFLPSQMMESSTRLSNLYQLHLARGKCLLRVYWRAWILSPKKWIPLCLKNRRRTWLWISTSSSFQETLSRSHLFITESSSFDKINCALDSFLCLTWCASDPVRRNSVLVCTITPFIFHLLMAAQRVGKSFKKTGPCKCINVIQYIRNVKHVNESLSLSLQRKSATCSAIHLNYSFYQLVKFSPVAGRLDAGSLPPFTLDGERDIIKWNKVYVISLPYPTLLTERLDREEEFQFHHPAQERRSLIYLF
jgi:hypothetical protein